MEVLLQLVLAAFLGGIIGIERNLAGKTAGMRTYALVALGSALFSLMSIYAFVDFMGITNVDPSRVASHVVVGIGFIGAGMIIFSENRLSGLTTAAGLWATAAIGMAVAYQFYLLAVFSTILILVIFVILWKIEIFLERKFKSRHRD